MNKNMSYALCGITIALVGGMIGGNWLSAQSVAEKTTSTDEVVGLLGHTTYVLKDSDGNIKAYRQTDNQVVNTGKNCVSKLLFLGTGSTNGGCSGTITAGGWKVIAIGNATTALSASVDTSNYTLNTASGSIVEGKTANAMGRQTANVYTGTNGGQNSTGTSGQAKAVLTATFGPMTGLGSGGTYVVSAGIFNSTTASATGMLAIQPVTAIQVKTGDSLSVTWTFTTG